MNNSYIYIYHVNVTQTVPDISPLMPMHQDPLLVNIVSTTINPFCCRNVTCSVMLVLVGSWVLRIPITNLAGDTAPTIQTLSPCSQSTIATRRYKTPCRNVSGRYTRRLPCKGVPSLHYSDVMGSQITGSSPVISTDCPGILQDGT